MDSKYQNCHDDSRKNDRIKSEKELYGSSRKEKTNRKDEEKLRGKRDRSRESRSRREDKLRERDRRERHTQKDKRHRRSSRSSSRSSCDKNSRKRSRSRETRRNRDGNSSRHLRDEEYPRESTRRPKGECKDHVDQKTQEILRSIEIPKEIRNKRDLVAKYQAEQLKKKAEEMSGVKIPTFYNTSNINPLVLAEQQRKRKLLWSKSKDNENTSTKMVGKAMVEGQDEKTAEKFRKLMGIKSVDESNDSKTTTNIHSMQQKAFDLMDKEYEYARVTTHLNRGKGLGFASHTANLLLDANQRLQFQ